MRPIISKSTQTKRARKPYTKKVRGDIKMNNLRYDGIQKGFNKISDKFAFTDLISGGSFLVAINEPDLEKAISDRVAQLHKSFGI